MVSRECVYEVKLCSFCGRLGYTLFGLRAGGIRGLGLKQGDCLLKLCDTTLKSGKFVCFQSLKVISQLCDLIGVARVILLFMRTDLLVNRLQFFVDV